MTTSSTLADLVLERLSVWFPDALCAHARLGFVASSVVTPPRGVIVVWNGKDPNPVAFVKVALTPEGVPAIRREHHVVKTLPVIHPRHRVAVPRALDFVQQDWGAAAMFSALPGRMPSIGVQGRRGALTAWLAGRFIQGAARVSEALATLPTPDGNEPVPWASEVKAAASSLHLCDRSRGVVESFAETLDRRGVASPASWQHGDLTPGNLLMHQGSIGVIDWEKASSRYPQWHDLVYAMLSIAFLGPDRCNPAENLGAMFSSRRAIGRALRRTIARSWRGPLPVGQAAAISALLTAGMSTRLGRSRAGDWADIAVAILAGDAVVPEAPWMSAKACAG